MHFQQLACPKDSLIGHIRDDGQFAIQPSMRIFCEPSGWVVSTSSFWYHTWMIFFVACLYSRNFDISSFIILCFKWFKQIILLWGVLRGRIQSTQAGQNWMFRESRQIIVIKSTICNIIVIKLWIILGSWWYIFCRAQLNRDKFMWIRTEGQNTNFCSLEDFQIQQKLSCQSLPCVLSEFSKKRKFDFYLFTERILMMTLSYVFSSNILSSPCFCSQNRLLSQLSELVGLTSHFATFIFSKSKSLFKPALGLE